MPELADLPWRWGRKVGRTIYAQLGPEPSDDDTLIGTMDTDVLAAVAVAAHNLVLRNRIVPEERP
jgi:hypothetical protein